jgi:hypothetical protein
MQVLFFGNLMLHHKLFHQSVYDLSGLVDSKLNVIDLEDYNLDHKPKRTGSHAFRQYGNGFPVVIKGIKQSSHIQTFSSHLLQNLIGPLLEVDFPDLAYRSDDEVRLRLRKIFSELPVNGFDRRYKNPCWESSGAHELACLPYAYILGQPKSGTSDLFMRLTGHEKIM